MFANMSRVIATESDLCVFFFAFIVSLEPKLNNYAET